ncbi:hypothetical protein H9P43_006651 [Blastocladiella emersonii ATCC 22665]|nr:hypothetical protein H9P43_006651 [Blastocladiella emersonii ATCC 22665]
MRVAETAAEFVDLLRDLVPEIPLVQALYLSRFNVPKPMFHVFAIFARETISDAEARRVFLNAADPDWNRAWVDRLHALAPRPGSTVGKFFAEFRALLDEVIDMDDPWVSSERPIKHVFANKLYEPLGRTSDPIFARASDASMTVADVAAEFASLAIPDPASAPPALPTPDTALVAHRDEDSRKYCCLFCNSMKRERHGAVTHETRNCRKLQRVPVVAVLLAEAVHLARLTVPIELWRGDISSARSLIEAMQNVRREVQDFGRRVADKKDRSNLEYCYELLKGLLALPFDREAWALKAVQDIWREAHSISMKRGWRLW